MIHGLAHGATVFSTGTTGGRNMAAAFLAQGYTVWLLDHRLSNRLGYAKQQHSMDDHGPARHSRCRGPCVPRCGPAIRVLAHCVGAGAFAMAAGGLASQKQQAKARSVTFPAHLPPHLAHAIDGEVLGEDAGDLRLQLLVVITSQIIGIILFNMIQ